MDFTFNTYSIILLFFGTVTFFLPYYIYKSNVGAVRWFSFAMLSNAIWCLGYGFELASRDLEQAKLFVAIQYIGITTLPVYWLLFCMKLSGQEKWYHRRRNQYILMFVTIISCIGIWTNDHHHLYYTEMHMDFSEKIPLLSFTRGIGYLFFTIYFYAMLLIANILLYASYRKSDAFYKRQKYSIIFASAIPWIANICYLIGLRPFGHMDITPFSFIISVFLVAIAVYRFKLFDILPVAREKVLDLMQDGFLIIDDKYRIIDYNKAARQYIYTDTKIVGMTMAAFFPGQEKLLNFVRNELSGKVAFSMESPKGLIHLEAEVQHLNESELNNNTTIVRLQDLTKIKQEELKSKQQTAELKRLNQLKDRIFSIIAHDLRGPLVNLSEVLKMISNDLITIEEFKMLSPTLTKDILYTTDLLENILHWSRSQLSGYGIKKEHFDLRSMVVNEINYHMPSAASKKVNIVQDIFPGKLVYADMLMVQIVVRNLLSNAIKFCHEGCQIDVFAVYHKSEMMELCIKDNGRGIEKNVLKKLFSGENHSTRGTMNEKGTGLGLMVCKEFMERNGGTIRVDSEPGKGSRFYIYVPVGEGTEDRY